VFEVGLMRKFRLNRIDFDNGEKHFVLDEFQAFNYSEYFKYFDLAKIKRISKKEAFKPLVLFREE
jgi:hypothetical protein